MEDQRRVVGNADLPAHTSCQFGIVQFGTTSRPFVYMRSITRFRTAFGSAAIKSSAVIFVYQTRSGSIPENSLHVLAVTACRSDGTITGLAIGESN